MDMLPFRLLKGFLFALALIPYAAHAQFLDNPIQVASLLELARRILQVVMILLAPIAGFMLVYAGLLFVVSRGNESKLETAKKAFTYGVIGTALIIGAWALVELLSGTLASFRA